MGNEDILNIISDSGCFKLDEALRAAVKLHTKEGTLVHRCQEDKKPWPCPTIDNIEGELLK